MTVKDEDLRRKARQQLPVHAARRELETAYVRAKTAYLVDVRKAKLSYTLTETRHRAVALVKQARREQKGTLLARPSLPRGIVKV